MHIDMEMEQDERSSSTRDGVLILSVTGCQDLRRARLSEKEVDLVQETAKAVGVLLATRDKDGRHTRGNADSVLRVKILRVQHINKAVGTLQAGCTHGLNTSIGECLRVGASVQGFESEDSVRVDVRTKGSEELLYNRVSIGRKLSSEAIYLEVRLVGKLLNVARDAELV